MNSDLFFSMLSTKVSSSLCLNWNGFWMKKYVCHTLLLSRFECFEFVVCRASCFTNIHAWIEFVKFYVLFLSLPLFLSQCVYTVNRPLWIHPFWFVSKSFHLIIQSLSSPISPIGHQFFVRLLCISTVFCVLLSSCHWQLWHKLLHI